MTLRDHFLSSGNLLFRWRSYPPLILVAAGLLGFRGFHDPAGSRLLHFVWELFCFGVSLSGLLVRVFTIGHVPHGTSGRNTAGQIANHLNTTGLYSVVRNPLYLGNYLMWLGVALLPRTLWVPVMMTLAFWIYYERIIFAEEEYLRGKFGGKFAAWSSMTPALVPRFGNWRPAEFPFSIRMVLRREYPGFLGLIAAFCLFEIVEEYTVLGRFRLHPFWEAAIVLALSCYCVLKLLKKKTSLLAVGDR